MTEENRRPRLSGRATDRVLGAELLAELRHHAQTSTEFAARLQGRVVNDVLQVETCAFDATAAPVQRQWHAAAGCVTVTNLDDADPLTVVAGADVAGAAAPPATGVGVFVILAGQTQTVAVASRAVTFYGTATQRFCYQAFTAQAWPAAG